MYRKKEYHQPRNKAGSDTRDFKIHDVFLNFCRREKIDVSIEMLGKVIKSGKIIGFDQQSIILEHTGGQQLVYKINVLSVTPEERVHVIFSSDDPAQSFHLEHQLDKAITGSEAGSEHAAHFA